MRSRGAWRGRIALDDATAVPLSIMGKRNRPDPGALALAGTIVGCVDLWRPSINAALVEHAADAGLLVGEIFVDDVPNPSFIAVIDLEGVPTIEFGFQVSWDDDHTIGVCMRDDVVVELNGSILEP